MIRLTRLNNQPFLVNSDLIKFVESSPDTTLTLLNNEKVIVRESSEQVMERILLFRRAVLGQAGVFAPNPAAGLDGQVPTSPGARDASAEEKMRG